MRGPVSHLNVKRVITRLRLPPLLPSGGSSGKLFGMLLTSLMNSQLPSRQTLSLPPQPSPFFAVPAVAGLISTATCGLSLPPLMKPVMLPVKWALNTLLANGAW